MKNKKVPRRNHKVANNRYMLDSIFNTPDEEAVNKELLDILTEYYSNLDMNYIEDQTHISSLVSSVKDTFTKGMMFEELKGYIDRVTERMVNMKQQIANLTSTTVNEASIDYIIKETDTLIQDAITVKTFISKLPQTGFQEAIRALQIESNIIDGITKIDYNLKNELVSFKGKYDVGHS